MDSNIHKLVTKHNPHIVIDPSGISESYDFTLYRTNIDYYVQPFRSRYGMLNGLVKIEAYGVLFRRMLEFEDDLEIEEYDTGPLSAQQYEVNGLMHQLARLPHLDLAKINQAIDDLMVHCSKNEWGNPFSKVAERMLLNRVREEHRNRPYSPITERSQGASLRRTYSLKKQQDEE